MAEKLGVSLLKPKNFNPCVSSCGCIVQHKNKFLFLQKAEGRWSEKLWGVPCGTMESLENPSSTMKRELFEETGLIAQINELKYLKEFFIILKDNFHYIHHVFFYKLRENKKISLSKEHLSYKWLSLKEIYTLKDLIPNQLTVFKLIQLGIRFK